MTIDPRTLTDAGERMTQGTPQSASLGIRLVSVEPGVAAMAVTYRDDLVGDPATGVLAGGVITTLLDHVCGLAVASAAGPVHSTATLDLRIDYMRAAEPGRDIIARARCYKLTHTIAFVRAAAFEDTEDDPVATAQGAFVLNLTAPKAPDP
jgi:uncharacterized protein (TIGR00369 family)